MPWERTSSTVLFCYHYLKIHVLRNVFHAMNILDIFCTSHSVRTGTAKKIRRTTTQASLGIQGQACFWCPPTMSDSGEVMEIVSIFPDKQVKMEGTDFS